MRRAPACTVEPAGADPAPAALDRFRRAVAALLGLQLHGVAPRSVAEALARRAGASGLAADAYLTRLEGAPPAGEAAALARELTVGETYFFRDAGQFRALRAWIAARPAGAGPLRVLSAGCATGEEPYSLAMTLRDALPGGGWTILAVDANPAAIDRARRGRYTRWALRETPPATLRRWFREEGAAVAIDESIRAAVAFEACNLLDDDPRLWTAGAWDVVFCRNVLIHFSRPAGQALAGRLAHALAPGGALFLGHAETLRGLSDALAPREGFGTFWYERPSRGGAALAAAGADAAEPVAPPAFSPAPMSGSIPFPVSGPVPVPAPADMPGTASSTDGLDDALELFRQERFREAAARASALPPSVATRPDARLLQGLLALHAGDFARARQAGLRLLADDESHAGAYHLLALCREGEGDALGAADADRRAVALDPGFAMPRLHLALLARRAGDAAEMRRQFERADALLEREDATRLLLFGGGFGRDALRAMCRAGLLASGGVA